MTDKRLLVLGLDGFEISLAEAMMASGELPNMASLSQRAAKFHLDHGRAKLTGLAWEHFSTGRAPENGGRWSAMSFDPETYAISQDPTHSVPIFDHLDARLVTFDAPYFDLAGTTTRGIASWGAHDPGTDPYSRPAGLAQELKERVGPYKGARHIYGFTWPSKERTIEAGTALVEAVEQRTAAVTWLLAERLPDWDVAIVSVSEPHSAIEQFWHGVDPSHPLHSAPSAEAAGRAIRGVYREIDKAIGAFRAAFPDAGLLVFAIHGMGPNKGDVSSMALLPELMFRLAFGRPHAPAPSWPSAMNDGSPILGPDEDWAAVMRAFLPIPSDRRLNRLWRKLGFPALSPSNIDWMPAARYRHFWPRMPAFALPSFYDGQIRLNLRGRERRGLVPISRYEAERDRIVAALRQTRCLADGLPVVSGVWLPKSEPLERAPSEADIYIQWRDDVTGFEHPSAGRIGPYPRRRTGGHTGERGFAWIDWPGVPPQGTSWRSAFDIAPTIFDLLGERIPDGISGTSLCRS